MDIASHLRKADRFAASMHCTRDTHPIATLWAAMHASTQALNALLHAHGVTPEERAYPTMTRGVYLVPSTTQPGHFESVELPTGDVIHATKGGSTLEWLYPDWDGLPAEVREAAELVAAVESLAKTRARDPGTSNGAELDTTLRRCEQVRSLASTILSDPPHPDR